MLDDRFSDSIEDQIASGRYKSATEVISTALCLLEERENRRNARARGNPPRAARRNRKWPSVPAEEGLSHEAEVESIAG